MIFKSRMTKASSNVTEQNACKRSFSLLSSMSLIRTSVMTTVVLLFFCGTLNGNSEPQKHARRPALPVLNSGRVRASGPRRGRGRERTRCCRCRSSAGLPAPGRPVGRTGRPQQDTAARPQAANDCAAAGQVHLHLLPPQPGEWLRRIAASGGPSRRETPPPWTNLAAAQSVPNRAPGPTAAARLVRRVRYTKLPAQRKKTTHHFLARRPAGSVCPGPSPDAIGDSVRQE